VIEHANDNRHPAVIASERDGERIVLTLAIPKTLFWFRGHFPGYPVLPGVVQLDWAVHYARWAFEIEAATVDSMKVKFRKPLQPEAHVRLTLSRAAHDGIDFEYAGDEIYSLGQLRFAGR